MLKCIIFLKKIFYAVANLFCKKQVSNKNDSLVSLRRLNDYFPNEGKTCLIAHNFGCTYDLDIIVPVYNQEKFIQRCLNSILFDSKYKIRVIVVNDGSSDNSLSILRMYEDKILLINQDNKGHSGARNSALDVIDAKYIMFVDSDDYIDGNVVDKMLGIALENNIDVVEASYKVFDDHGVCRNGKICKLGDDKYQMSGYPWGKIFKSSLFADVGFPEKYWFEDSIVKMLICNKANSYFCIPDFLYYYFINPQGVSMASLKKKKSLDALYVILSIHEDRLKLGMESDLKYYEYLLGTTLLLFKRIRKLPRRIRLCVFFVWCDFLEKNFNGLSTNKYKEIQNALFIKKNFNLLCLLI